MSWNAKRYRKTHLEGTNKHHIPPRHPSASIPVRKRVNKRDHAAYHQLFQNASSFEQCVSILKWWWSIRGQLVRGEEEASAQDVLSRTFSPRQFCQPAPRGEQTDSLPKGTHWERQRSSVKTPLPFVTNILIELIKKMRDEDARGWICDECDTLNLDTEVCASCGYRANYFRHSLKLLKIQGIWATAKEWQDKLNLSLSGVYKKAEAKKTRKML